MFSLTARATPQLSYLNHKSEHIKYNWSYSQAGGKIIKRLVVLATKLNSVGANGILNNLNSKCAKNGEKRFKIWDFDMGIEELYMM